MSKKKKYRHNISRPTHRASPPVSDGDKKTPDDVSYSSDKKTPGDEKTPGIASNSHDKKTPATWSSCPKRLFIDCPKKGRRCSTCGWNPAVEGLRIEALKRRMETDEDFRDKMTRAVAMIRQTPKKNKAYRSDTYSDADTEYTDAFDDATLSPVVGMASVSETATDYDEADLDEADIDDSAEDDDSWVEAQIEKLFRGGFS